MNMTEEQYSQVFRNLGIKYNPLPENYTPDSYGQSLLSSFCEVGEVSYSSSTECYKNDRKAE